MCRKFDTLEERLDYIEFREELLYNADSVSRVLFEHQLTDSEYKAIMNLMDNYRYKLEKGEQVSNAAFEQEVYKIVPFENGDYHMCEDLVKAFAENNRWEEVFPALYGGMAKYGG